MSDNNLDSDARKAYEAFAEAARPMLGAMPTWGTMPPDAREHWRAVGRLAEAARAEGRASGIADMIGALQEAHRTAAPEDKSGVRDALEAVEDLQDE